MLARIGGAGIVVARFVGVLIASLLLLPYLLVPVYEPHAATPFTGAALFNPYATLGTSWQRANFHAHSHAWGGVTAGRDTPEALRAAYLRLGYDVIGISNYHTITRASGTTNFVPVYEHGFSIRKTHQIVIGAQAVLGLDFPLYQNTAAKQYLLQRVQQRGALTAIVHPYLRMGYDTTELAQLSGYELLEVRSHWNDASAWWDAALTAGNPVWAIGNDDVHDTRSPRETGVVWTMVNAASAAPDDVIGALRAGRMYVVSGDRTGQRRATAPRLEQLSVRGDTLTVQFDRPMQSIRIIGDSGAARATSLATAGMTYVLPHTDHYARIVASTDEHTLYFNPVLRATGVPQPWPVPPVREAASILSRATATVTWLLAMLLLWPGALTRVRRAAARKRLVPAPTVSGVVMLATLLVAAAPAAAAQRSPTPFTVGENHEYDLKFGVLQVGSGSLSVHGPDSVRGREVLRLRYEMRGGIPLFRVHDVMESWFDVEKMRSLRFTQDLNEGSKHYNRFYDFYPDELVVLERGKPRAATVADPLDDAAFIFYVRTLKLEVGQTLTFNRYFRPNANPVTIQVLRRESITVPAGTFNTIVVKPIIRTSGIFSEGGQAELWFTDDASHTLVQMKAKLAFGSLSLYLRPSRNRR